MICVFNCHGRFIQAFDFEGYQKWKSQDDTSSKEEVQQEQQQPDDSKEKDTKENDDKPPKFTFQELVEMIESGKEIPGRKDMEGRVACTHFIDMCG